jgi:SAM-dependent methyltransferase
MHRFARTGVFREAGSPDQLMSPARSRNQDLLQVLPPRYFAPWKDPFEREIAKRLRSGMTILDIGGGRHPTLPPADRPDDTTYVGLDLSRDEFEAASDDAYDRTIVADAATPIPELAGSVDLVVSWQVFEHLRPLADVLTNTHQYLNPGGALVSFFSGRWSVFALLNKLLPTTLGAPVVSRIHQRKAINRPVFPAYYDACSDSELRRQMAYWRRVEIHSYYRAATYFGFARPMVRAYLMYENAIARVGWRNGATHYLLVAEK